MAYEKFGSKFGLTANSLAALYKEHTDLEIAQKYGVAEITVRRWRKDCGILTLTDRQRRDGLRGGLSIESLTESKLRELSLVHTDVEIGELYGVSKFPIMKLREKFGIEAVRHGRREESLRGGVFDVFGSEEIDVITLPPVQIPKVTMPPTSPPKRYEPESKLAKEARQARERRAAKRLINPAKTTRTVTCVQCGTQWEVGLGGSFRYCDTCKEEAAKENRSKTCAYCDKPFMDTGVKNCTAYCTVECRRRAKLERLGKASPGGYLQDRIYTCQNPSCEKSFTPSVTGQKFCSIGCRTEVYAGGDTDRQKVCKVCQKEFVDTSLNNNQQSHPACSRRQWGHKPNPDRELYEGPHLEEKRFRRVRLGDGGRLDEIATMKKNTQSWWGRVAELIFAAYRPDAKDVNISNGGRSPYDFDDPEYGHIDVRSRKETTSPEGRPMWSFATTGLKESCDHAFFVAFDSSRRWISHLWLVPKADLNDSLMRMAPDSKDYVGSKWDITTEWGTMIGNGVLSKALTLPDPVKPEGRFDWISNPENFKGTSSAHRGRRAEFLYHEKYPDSIDMNVKEGIHAIYDFQDSDGSTVNVKSSRRHPKSDQPSLRVWSFSLLARHQLISGHKCQLYSCLCLDETGRSIIWEYRIPIDAIGDRTLIHIYDQDGGQWKKFRVPV